MNHIFSLVDRRLPYVAAGVLLFSLFGYLQGYHFVFELFCHYKFQLMLVALIFLAFAVMRKSTPTAILLIIAIFVNLFELSPYMVIQAKEYPDSNLSQGLKLLQANVLSSNQRYELLKNLIKKETPDLIILQEVNSGWAENLNSLIASYPHHMIIPRNDNFGMAVFSKLEFAEKSILNLSELAIPSISVILKLESGRALRLISTHPIPPISARAATLRNKHLESIAKEVLRENLPIIVAGDLNVTMYSSNYKDMISASGLSSVREGNGIYSSWPAFLGRFGIPIDHILYKGAFKCKNVKILEAIGSDHLPLLAELSL